MNDLKDILRQLRIDRKLSQLALAQLLNISPTGYAGWEQGRTEPNIESIRKLCKLFEVSADYLLGLEDEFGNKTY